MQLIGNCIIVYKSTNNFMNIDLKPLFDNILPFFINFENPFFLCKMVKATLNPTTSSMEKHFTT